MKKLLITGALALSLLSLSACSSSKESTKSSGSATSSSSKKEDNGWNDATKTFTTKDGVLKIDGVEKATDYEGKPVIKINFTLTNKKAEATNVQVLFMLMAQIQQKSENTSNNLNFAIMPSDAPENHIDDNLNPDGTISGYYPLELENETDPIIINFQKNFATAATYEISLN